MQSYYIPDLTSGQVHRKEDLIRHSRFIVTIAHTATVEEAKYFINQIRQEHINATHNCWAYCACPPGNTSQIGASDDGEPKGTAGRPMLTVLEHCGIGELTAVVTRYFGGTLLGTGGLVHAYQGMVKLGLESLPTRLKVPSRQFVITVEHRFFSQINNFLTRFDARILNKQFSSDVSIVFEVPISQSEALLAIIRESTSGRVRVIQLP